MIHNLAMTFFQLDAWSGWHLFCAYFLSHLICRHVLNRKSKSITFKSWRIDMAASALIAFMFSFFWEIGDQFIKIGFPFDPRGGSFDDLIAALIGCILAIFI